MTTLKLFNIDKSNNIQLDIFIKLGICCSSLGLFYAFEVLTTREANT